MPTKSVGTYAPPALAPISVTLALVLTVAITPWVVVQLSLAAVISPISQPEQIRRRHTNPAVCCKIDTPEAGQHPTLLI
jgi:hypothetical protein